MESTVEKALPIQLTFFLLYIVGFGIAETERDRKLLNFCLTWSIWSQLVGFIITTVDIYYTWGSFNELLYSLLSVLTNMVNNSKFIMCMIHRQKYLKLLRTMKYSLWRNIETENARRVLKKCENQATLFVLLFLIFSQGCGIGYAVEAITVNINNNGTDVRQRVFPFKVWFDLPIYESPTFQMFFVFQVLVTSYTCVLYCCFDNCLALVNVYIAGQFTILRYRLEHLCNTKIFDSTQNSDKQQMKLVDNADDLGMLTREFQSCIKHHQSLIRFTGDVEDIYTSLNLISVMVLSFMICLAGYQLIMPGNSLIRRGKFVLFIFGCLTQLFSFSFTCNNVFVSSVDLSDGPYNFTWYNENWSKKGRALTRDFMIMIMRSQRPCCLTAGGFFPITLNTLKSALTSAFSYLTLIRQSAA